MLHGNPSWSYYWRKLVLGPARPLPLHRARPHRHGPVRQARRTTQLRLHAAVARRRPRAPARLARHLRRRHHPRRARLGRHDRLRLGAHAQRAGQAPGDPQHRGVSAAGGQADAVAAQARPRFALGALADPRLQRLRRGATRFGVVNERCRPTCARAYIAPYDSWANRISTLRFVQDIPLCAGDPAWPLVEAAGNEAARVRRPPGLHRLGPAGFRVRPHFLEGFQRALPQRRAARVRRRRPLCARGQADVLVPAIRAFLDRSHAA